MTTNTLVMVFDDRPALIAGIADRFVSVMTDVLSQQDVAHVVLTGGTVGIDTLAAIGEPVRSEKIDWSRVHLWWGDERWLVSGSSERNDAQADAALLSLIDCPATNIHRFPAADGDSDLDAAAAEYAAELERFASEGDRFPAFDIVFLGVGPDGHIASLFPGHDGIKERDETVISVRNAPKPPPERLSLTLPVINSARRVWLCLSGSDKASALGLALAGANASEVPAAGVTARNKTVFFIDQAAAAEVPKDLLTGDSAA
jgi:6-phosphogluconolactonase